jgi:hypothetical protein
MDIPDIFPSLIFSDKFHLSNIYKKNEEVVNKPRGVSKLTENNRMFKA